MPAPLILVDENGANWPVTGDTNGHAIWSGLADLLGVDIFIYAPLDAVPSIGPRRFSDWSALHAAYADAVTGEPTRPYIIAIDDGCTGTPLPIPAGTWDIYETTSIVGIQYLANRDEDCRPEILFGDGASFVFEKNAYFYAVDVATASSDPALSLGSTEVKFVAVASTMTAGAAASAPMATFPNATEPEVKLTRVRTVLSAAKKLFSFASGAKLLAKADDAQLDKDTFTTAAGAFDITSEVETVNNTYSRDQQLVLGKKVQRVTPNAQQAGKVDDYNVDVVMVNTQQSDCTLYLKPLVDGVSLMVAARGSGKVVLTVAPADVPRGVGISSNLVTDEAPPGTTFTIDPQGTLGLRAAIIRGDRRSKAWVVQSVKLVAA